jgi:hypothetical protein
VTVTIPEDLDSQAAWRRRKALEHPEDRRNVDAAELLEKLTKEASKLDQNDLLLKRLEKCLDRLSADKRYELFSEEQSDYHRQIGFSRFPLTVKEYLEDLTKIAEKLNEGASER